MPKPLVPCPKNALSGQHRFNAGRRIKQYDPKYIECQHCDKTYAQVKEERKKKRRKTSRYCSTKKHRVSAKTCDECSLNCPATQYIPRRAEKCHE